MSVDVLELFLDEEVPAQKPAEVAPDGHDDLDLLLQEFRSSEDPQTQKDALSALLQLMRK